jgi:putative nucleotidyltransferase with HDIG domain
MFVDDEPNVLDGLKRTLRPLRREWDMRFANSGSEALALMAADPADVLVTDMRMPGMDGDELLAEIRRRHPATTRIVLTGQCTREAMVRLVALAHRIMSKPCDPVELKATVESAVSLQHLLTSPSLVALVSQLRSIPSPPILYGKVLAQLEKPEGSLAEIGNLLAQDLGMSAKIMQVANSALFGSRHSAADPTQAVQRLGAEITRAIVLAADVFTRYDPHPICPFSIDDLWAHSQKVGALAGHIARAEGATERVATDARLAGLLHDIGRLIMVTQQPEQYKEVFGLLQAGDMTIVQAELRVFGATHADVGAYLLGLWGLPGAFVEAVAWHHAPAGCPSSTFQAVTAVHAAECLLAAEEGGAIDTEYLNRLGLGDRPGKWVDLQNAVEAKTGGK